MNKCNGMVALTVGKMVTCTFVVNRLLFASLNGACTAVTPKLYNQKHKEECH